VEEGKGEKMIQGYKKATKTRLKRIIMNIEGQEKQGKTHFSLTAPGPIAFIDMDTGTEGVVDKFIKDKEIWVKNYNWKDATSQTEWTEMWEDSKRAYMNACSSKEMRTIVIDTSTEHYEMIRLARFGKINKIAMQDGKALPFPYGPVNTEFRDLIKKVYDSDKNLILIHKLKKSYVNEVWKGGYERSGYSDIPYVVQMNVRVWRIDGTFGLTITDSRHNADLAGQEIIGPMCSFPFLATQVFPETKESEWE